eukprot:TRINITY_DN6454_c0_g1_i9.p1 TRINITY_DN6454_c0_g1~~TRINITY_DN6454_c0_g1_i9.p1  ORF type:complete len:469 (+),score=126.49 TRINITY_DN6454_c0_g1_i9:71-1408(+)
MYPFLVRRQPPTGAGAPFGGGGVPGYRPPAAHDPEPERGAAAAAGTGAAAVAGIGAAAAAGTPQQPPLTYYPSSAPQLAPYGPPAAFPQQCWAAAPQPVQQLGVSRHPVLRRTAGDIGPLSDGGGPMSAPLYGTAAGADGSYWAEDARQMEMEEMHQKLARLAAERRNAIEAGHHVARAVHAAAAAQLHRQEAEYMRQREALEAQLRASEDENAALQVRAQMAGADAVRARQESARWEALEAIARDARRDAEERAQQAQNRADAGDVGAQELQRASPENEAEAQAERFERRLSDVERQHGDLKAAFEAQRAVLLDEQRAQQRATDDWHAAVRERDAAQEAVQQTRDSLQKERVEHHGQRLAALSESEVLSRCVIESRNTEARALLQTESIAAELAAARAMGRLRTTDDARGAGTEGRRKREERAAFMPQGDDLGLSTEGFDSSMS